MFLRMLVATFTLLVVSGDVALAAQNTTLQAGACTVYTDNPAASIAACDQTITSISTDPKVKANALRIRALLHELTRKPDASNADLAAALAIDSSMAENSLAQSLIFHMRGQKAEALAKLEEATRQAPNDLELLITAANNFSLMEESDRTVAVLSRIIEIDAGHIGALRMRGDQFLRQGDYKAALRDVAIVLRRYPRDAVALRIRGFARFNQRDLKRAIRDFDALLAQANSDPVALAGRAAAFLQRGSLQKARKDYEKLMATGNAGVSELILYGSVLQQQENNELALSHFDSLLKSYPDEAQVHNGRCWSLAQLKRLDEALTACNRAISLDGNKSSNIFNCRAFVHEKRRKFDLAARDYEASLKLNPSDPYAKQELKRMKKAAGKKR